LVICETTELKTASGHLMQQHLNNGLTRPAD